jgi:hypothetical protein
MSTVGNGTTGASDTGTASGYNLELSLFLYRLNMNTSNPYDTIMLLIFTHNMIYFMIFKIKICRFMIFEIKIYRKMVKTLTSVSPPLLFFG